MYKKIKLNEAIMGNCNMEVPEGSIETKGTVPEVYADAINQRIARKKKFEKDFEKQDKVMKEFTKESQKTETKQKGTPKMEKLSLDESLFEEDIDDDKLYKRAEKLADDIVEFLDDINKLENVNDYLSETDLEDIGNVSDMLNDFAQTYSYITDNETVMEGVQKGLVEDKEPDFYYHKKREPLFDIIQLELTDGERVYKVSNGKYIPTKAPSLNLDIKDVSYSTDNKGDYLGAWVPDEATQDKVVEIAKKYHRDYKKGYDKYVADKNKYYVRIYLKDTDYDEPYYDPDVPTYSK